VAFERLGDLHFSSVRQGNWFFFGVPSNETVTAAAKEGTLHEDHHLNGTQGLMFCPIRHVLDTW
jgi:hypothetical protein